MVLWGVVVVLFRCQLRKWVARWMCGGSFESSKLQFSLEPLSQPAALLSGETVLWYNAQFRARLLNGQDVLVSRVQKVMPGLDLQQCRKQEGQLLTLADGMWSVHSSTVPGNAESMTLLVLNEETALRKVEAEYKASRPGYLVFLVDGYDDVFGDMLDSERARLLEGINRTLEDMIGRGSGFLRRVASGRYIAVVEERQMEQFANRGYDVLDKIRALDPSVNLSLSIGIGRGAKTLREAQDMAVQALDMAQGRGGDQAAEMTPDGFTFYGGVSHGVEKRSKVRSRIVADQLVKLIKEADHVVIMGHRMSDLDAIGSAEGVLRICKICDVPAVIAVRRDATLAGSLIDALCKAGQRDDFHRPEGCPAHYFQTHPVHRGGYISGRSCGEQGYSGKMRQGGRHRSPPQGRGLHPEPGPCLPRALFLLGQRAGHRTFAVRGRARRQTQPGGSRGPALRYHAGYPRFYPAHRCAYL